VPGRSAGRISPDRRMEIFPSARWNRSGLPAGSWPGMIENRLSAGQNQFFIHGPQETACRKSAAAYYMNTCSDNKKQNQAMATGNRNEDRCGVRCIHRDRVEKARQTALPADAYARLAELFKAMGDTTRLRILQALAYDEMCVCDLAGYLQVSESAVSHQLRLLRQLHLVTNRREGPVLYYRLDDEHVSLLVNLGLEHIRE